MIQTVDVSEIHAVDSESSDTYTDKYPKHSTPIKTKLKSSIKNEKKRPSSSILASRESSARSSVTPFPHSSSLRQDKTTPTIQEKFDLSTTSQYKSGRQTMVHEKSGSSFSHGRSAISSNVHEKSFPSTSISQDRPSLSTTYKDTSTLLQPVGQNALETSTIQKQRDEIKLLISELKERDQELNEMVADHQNQLISWQNDRKKIILLEQKCKKYKTDLSVRTEQLDITRGRLEELERSCTAQLENNKLKLNQLLLDKDSQSNLVMTLEDRNRSLNDSLKEASCTVGELAAREQEMATLIKIKDKEIKELKEQFGDLYTRYQKLEKHSSECHYRERDAFGQSTQWQQKYNQALRDIQKLRVDIEERDDVLTQQIAQINEAQQHMIQLQEALIVSNEREKSKDDILTSLKAKEERRSAELRTLRELYERQQRELTLLQMNLDSSQVLENITYHNNSVDQSLIDPNIPELDQSLESTRSETTRMEEKKKVSFDDRLSKFLDSSSTEHLISDTPSSNLVISEKPFDESVNKGEISSPGSKLQRLITESKNLIDTLEKSTLPVSSTTQQQLQGFNQNENSEESTS